MASANTFPKSSGSKQRQKLVKTHRFFITKENWKFHKDVEIWIDVENDTIFLDLLPSTIQSTTQVHLVFRHDPSPDSFGNAICKKYSRYELHPIQSVEPHDNLADHYLHQQIFCHAPLSSQQRKILIISNDKFRFAVKRCLEEVQEQCKIQEVQVFGGYDVSVPDCFVKIKVYLEDSIPFRSIMLETRDKASFEVKRLFWSRTSNS